MAKFRTNHQRGSRGRNSHPFRTTIMLLVIATSLLLFLFVAHRLQLFSGLFGFGDPESLAPEDRFYLPAGCDGRVYHRTWYSLCYAESYEVAAWVAYELKRERLQRPWVKRTDNFRADLEIATRSSDPKDYRRSGYDRGHLVPAADMAFHTDAMSETFLMSNVSPQLRAFNGGIWRELEEITREWAKRFKRLFVVSGPVLSEQPLDYIGRNRVSVPAAFYKVLLDVDQPEQKGIAFLIPNARSDQPLDGYMLSIDSLETLTGLDFFADFLQDTLEARLESSYDPNLWPLDRKKFRKRIDNWNNR